MISDYHLHSCFSSDSDESITNILDSAIAKGMDSICLTDHMDYDFPITEPGCTFSLDIPGYTKELERFRDIYHEKIKLNIGMELGLQPHISSQNHHLVNSYPFDFVIASTHVVNGADPYHKEYWKNNSIKDSLTVYFNDILTCISNFDDFDVYGHLDYIIRYIPNKSFTFCYDDYSDTIDLILKKLIAMGKGIEINTGGYKYGLNSPNPSITIAKRYRELGGEIITIGSDAHTADYVGYCFENIPNFLKEAGFNYYNTFENRIPIKHYI